MLGVEDERILMVKAKKRYYQILKDIPEYGENDVLLVNLISAAIFDRCGIWHMMQELGIPEVTPAVCRYDYGMTKLTGAEFSRKQTLADGGTVCDCHYKKETT